MTQWGLDNLFNPGKRHMDDEKRRLQSTREEVGDNSGGRRIDLEGGKVSISVRRGSAPAPDTEVDADALDPALDAEAVPGVALAGGEAEIEPPVAGTGDDEPEDAPAAAGNPAAPESTPKPEPTPVTPRRGVSADAWSRRG